jgi:hypothetical protein
LNWIIRGDTPGEYNLSADYKSTSGDVKEDGQLGNVQSLTNFYSAVKNTSECGLPDVSWIHPTKRSPSIRRR